MKIEIDTTNLSALDIKLLAVLAGDNWPAADYRPGASAPQAVDPAPAPKVKPKAPKPEPVVAAAVVATAQAVVEDEAPADDAPTVTMADAVAAATQLVSSGGAAKVKEALATVGAKRVSEVPTEDLAAFLAALS